MHDEVEVKFLNIDPAAMDIRLRNYGAVLEYDEELISVYFGPADVVMFAGDSRQPEVRLRTRNGMTTLTYKSPADGATRKESEVGVADAAIMQEILLRLGYVVLKSVRKHRRHYVKDLVQFEIDVYNSLPPLLEIEARSLYAIQETCKALGLDYSMAKTGTIAELYAIHKGPS